MTPGGQKGVHMDIFAFWKAVLAQDAAALKQFFHEDAYINWHCTNERFTVEEFIVANCEYPGDWDGEIERVEVLNDLYITAVRVYPRDRSASFHVTSFAKVADGKILSMDEYWADDGTVPQWRQDKHIGTAIRLEEGRMIRG